MLRPVRIVGPNGEKAITLCMPRSYKTAEVDDETGEKVERSWMRFIFKAQWFVLSQTDGDDWELLLRLKDTAANIMAFKDQ